MQNTHKRTALAALALVLFLSAALVLWQFIRETMLRPHALSEIQQLPAAYCNAHSVPSVNATAQQRNYYAGCGFTF